ncbi:hypothetical protein mvi_25250 [Methylobacterium indicum]|uniref:Uncharacterized protein n=1 Tax=Methylobacterium indicum TaxID=1775910 RepID=A0A8H8WTI3_9HYPH|nr:hypothetical protein mvi_25250 [Methylobacterium indicum]
MARVAVLTVFNVARVSGLKGIGALRSGAKAAGGGKPVGRRAATDPPRHPDDFAAPRPPVRQPVTCH